MSAKWTPFLIKDFLGKSTKRTPPANACADILGLDFRSTEGDMVSPAAVTDLYANPGSSETLFTKDATNYFLGMTTQFFPDLTDTNHPNGAEAVFVFLKGTVNYSQTGIDISAFWDRKMVGVFMRPYWNGVTLQWVDDWNWVNKVLISTISGINVYGHAYSISILGSPTLEKNSVLVDVTASPIKYANFVSQSGYEIETTRNDLSAGDVILVTNNYFPFVNYHGPTGSTKGIYETTVDQICFHKLLNDLRIGWGGRENRLGMGIGIRKKFFQTDKISELSQVCLDPYNVVTDAGTFDFNTNLVINLPSAASPAPIPVGGFNRKEHGKQLEIALTVVLDGTDEFLVKKSMIYVPDFSTKKIEAISTAAEAVFTITNHGLLNGQLIGIQTSLGKSITSLPADYPDRTVWLAQLPTQYYESLYVEVLTANTFKLLKPYWVGGVFTRNAVDTLELTGAYNPALQGYLLIGETGSTVGQAYSMKPIVRFATMNKRVTSLRVWIGKTADNGLIDNHYLLQELSISKDTSGTGWSFDSSGNIILTESTGISFEAGNVIPSEAVQTVMVKNPVVNEIVVANAFYVTYEKYNAAVENGKTLETFLDKANTLNYVKDWQQAIVSAGTVHLVSPWIDKRYSNWMIKSVIDGYGNDMKDVIPVGNSISLDNKDGNDIVAVQVLPNMNFMVGRNINVEIVSPSGVPITTLSGIGLNNRKGLINYFDRVAIFNPFDLYTYGYGNLENLTEDTIRDEYRALIATKSVKQVNDINGNSLRFAFQGDNYEYIYIRKKGFTKIALTDLSIQDYAIDKDGNILRAAIHTNGNFYIQKIDNSKYLNGTFLWESVPIDTTLIAELGERKRFIIRNFWIDYESQSNFSAQFAFDEGSFESALTIPGASTPTVPNCYYPIRLPAGKNCRKFRIKISGQIADDLGESYRRFRIRSMGFDYMIREIGLHG